MRTPIIKVCVIAFCLLELINKASGQDITMKLDSVRYFFFKDTKPLHRLHKKLTLVIDGEMVTDTLLQSTLKNLNAGDILEIYSFKPSLLKDFYPEKPVDLVAIIVTKNYATNRYKRNLSLKSKKYAVYLQKHLNDDKHIVYIINGGILNRVPIQGNEIDNVTKKLYGIPFKNIRRVKYLDNYVEGMKNGGVVAIKTINKKQSND